MIVNDHFKVTSNHSKTIKSDYFKIVNNHFNIISDHFKTKSEN